MTIGKTQYETGTRIVIKGLTDEDKDMNGLTGTLTQPFRCFEYGDVGVYLDSNKIMNICNLKIGEFEVIKE
jgi:hypothetical protein